MLRILTRYALLSGRAFYPCTKRRSSSVVLCLKWQRAEFNAVDVNLAQLEENYSLEEFSVRLKESILQWRKDGKKSVWMRVPVDQSYLVPVAFDQGFSYHHAVGDHAMLLKWLPQRVPSKVPPYATHQVGVSGLAFNEKKSEVLVVQDKHTYTIGQKKKAFWKFPGGLSDEGESFEETATREVYEETGIKTEFRSVLLFRQQHEMKHAFGKSDIYLICRMEPQSYGISHCEDEIARCEWMKLSTLLTHTDVSPLSKLAARLVAHGVKHGFDSVDMVGNQMRSWVNPDQKFTLYHRFLPS